MAEEGTHLNGGTAGGDQSEPAPTITPCRMNGMWGGNTFPLYNSILLANYISHKNREIPILHSCD
jgi:hypothetical protein